MAKAITATRTVCVGGCTHLFNRRKQTYFSSLETKIPPATLQKVSYANPNPNPKALYTQRISRGTAALMGSRAAAQHTTTSKLRLLRNEVNKIPDFTSERHHAQKPRPIAIPHSHTKRHFCKLKKAWEKLFWGGHARRVRPLFCDVSLPTVLLVRRCQSTFAVTSNVEALESSVLQRHDRAAANGSRPVLWSNS